MDRATRSLTGTHQRWSWLAVRICAMVNCKLGKVGKVGEAIALRYTVKAELLKL
ncbi:hypothetical protein PN477_15125 [Spirulina subsalsa CS-330]|nr:hypothetical protein [Spirulina subsalsa CS-330]